MLRMILLASVAALFGCAGAPARPAADSTTSQATPGAQTSPALADSEIGLAKGSVFEPAPPPAFADNAVDPGSSKPLPASFVGEPVPIPHSVADALPITASSNPCLDCHGSGDDAPRPPASHYVDMRAAPAKTGAEVDASRYLCDACHLAMTDAQPLVENSFEP